MAALDKEHAVMEEKSASGVTLEDTAGSAISANSTAKLDQIKGSPGEILDRELENIQKEMKNLLLLSTVNEGSDQETVEKSVNEYVKNTLRDEAQSDQNKCQKIHKSPEMCNMKARLSEDLKDEEAAENVESKQDSDKTSSEVSAKNSSEDSAKNSSEDSAKTSSEDSAINSSEDSAKSSPEDSAKSSPEDSAKSSPEDSAKSSSEGSAEEKN